MAPTTTILPSPWDDCADAYAGMVDDLRPVTDAILTLFRPALGERILDVATGPGEPAIRLAAAVGVRGSVVGIDASKGMVRVARERAANARSTASFLLMDATALRFPDASFDAVVSRFGMHLLDAPDVAAREWRRVLRPGGRALIATWGPAAGTPVGALLESLGVPDEPCDGAALLRRAGLVDVKEERLLLSLPGTPRDALARFAAASPLAVLMGERAKVLLDGAADGAVSPVRAPVILTTGRRA